MPFVSDVPQKLKARGLDKFRKLTVKEQRSMCYVNPFIVPEFFPTNIEKLKAHSRKLAIDTNHVETKLTLAQIHDAQAWRQIRQERMSKLEQLSDPPIDRV